MTQVIHTCFCLSYSWRHQGWEGWGGLPGRTLPKDTKDSQGLWQKPFLSPAHPGAAPHLGHAALHGVWLVSPWWAVWYFFFFTSLFTFCSVDLPSHCCKLVCFCLYTFNSFIFFALLSHNSTCLLFYLVFCYVKLVLLFTLVLHHWWHAITIT